MLVSNIGSENSLDLKIHFRERKELQIYQEGKTGEKEDAMCFLSFVMASANMNVGIGERSMAARVFSKNNLPES